MTFRRKTKKAALIQSFSDYLWMAIAKQVGDL
jgi:hypothetical protein